MSLHFNLEVSSLGSSAPIWKSSIYVGWHDADAIVCILFKAFSNIFCAISVIDLQLINVFVTNHFG